MTRAAFLLAVLFLHSVAVCAHESKRPVGKNCELAEPPAGAGEETNHGVVLRIFPRAKDIDAKYTGCQVLFAPEKEKWVAVSLTEVVNGDPVRVWSDHEQSAQERACRYKSGKLVAGIAETCPSPEFILIKSLAPGCVRLIQDAAAKQGIGAVWPPQCVYQ